MTTTPRQLTTPDQAKMCADHLYKVWHGYYMLQQMVVYLFDQPVIGGGYYDVRPIDYDETLTIRLTNRQALRLVYQNKDALKSA
jgi:hypothetical protein